ncbi:MAG: S-methyl-5-thioribose-1-phosphate isomerase, partial [Bacteroidetes bacterium]|nr:S-methyl-5-thioribose-1-phosphate isomerase [Bacteroidota bacterium]
MNFTQSIWLDKNTQEVTVIDQRKLPFEETTQTLATVDDVCFAIKDMVVRGAPLIGVTAAYGLYIAAKTNFDLSLAYGALLATRPTAINLKWALDSQMNVVSSIKKEDIEQALLNNANNIRDEDINMCSQIGNHGFHLIKQIHEQTRRSVNILTHCNAGWLATVQWGTATAPIYKAHQAGIPIHIWVDETRPRNQGANLTAWELSHAGIPFHVITDNAGGHLMQHGKVDLVLVGSDRTTAAGDVCNKIGTYLKALAACENNIPFYAALPVSTIDWSIKDGVNDIPIEER